MASLSLMGTKFTGNLLQGMKYQQKVFDAAEKQDGVEEALKMLIGHKELQGEAGRKATHKGRDEQARFTVQATATGYAPYSFKEHVPMHETRCEKMTPIMEQMASKIMEQDWGEKVEDLNTAIVNVYPPGAVIPPHIDDKAYARPFFTATFNLSEQEATLLLGTKQ